MTIRLFNPLGYWSESGGALFPKNLTEPVLIGTDTDNSSGAKLQVYSTGDGSSTGGSLTIDNPNAPTLKLNVLSAITGGARLDFARQGALKYSFGYDVNGSGGLNFFIFDQVHSDPALLVDGDNNNNVYVGSFTDDTSGAKLQVTGAINTTGYMISGTAGISTTITTASLVGKTITITNGIVTDFS